MQPTTDDKRRRDRRAWIILLVLCAIGAAAITRRMVALGGTPSAAAREFGRLDEHFTPKAGLTLLHIIPSLFFVLLVPLQFVDRVRRRYPRWHRWMGRVLMSLGAVI